MYCPDCDKTYPDDQSLCPKCRKPLVPDNKAGDFQTILDTHSIGDVMIIKSIFDAEAIEYYFLGEHVGQYLFQAIPYTLRVKTGQAERAAELLADYKLIYNLSSIPDLDDDSEENQVD